jgi:hypothetical protein
VAGRCRVHYLRFAMVPLPRPASPRALWRDLKAFFAERHKHHWIALGLALLIPVLIFFGFIYDHAFYTKPREEITYFESWRADRSLEETRANIEKRAADRKAAEERRRQEYQQLKDQLGF